jgi:ABC-2 type transport system permease protein
MAVYEHSYKPYEGALTSEWSRFLVIPRYAYQDIFKSRIFAGLFAICFVPALVEAVLIYLHHNASALEMMRINVAELVPINNVFFRVFSGIQESLAFLLAVIIGPPLISRDLSNNALPLYLCRPFSRTDYVVGKMSVLLIMLSAVTWIPGLLLFVFQSFLEGFAWFTSNLWIAGAIFLSNGAWVLLLTLLSVALSALIKWRVAASGALFAFFTIPAPVALIITGLFETRWGLALSPSFIMQRLSEALFRIDSLFEVRGLTLPVSGAWIIYLLICSVCLLLLTQRIRAYEVVK